MAAYSVSINNIAGSVTSSNVTLTVFVAPAISLAPISQSVGAGSNVVFAAAAEWDRAPCLAVAQRIEHSKRRRPYSRGHFANLTLTGLSQASAGIYSVTVSNVAGADSRAASLVVIDPPILTSQPPSLSIAAGSNAVFHVGVLGTPRWSISGLKSESNSAMEAILPAPSRIR